MSKKLYSLWLKLRKRTVPAHWAFGVLCAVVWWQFFPAAAFLIGLFAFFEWWNDKNMRVRVGDLYKPEGDEDWWDSFVVLCMCLSPMIILNIVGIISIRWY